MASRYDDATTYSVPGPHGSPVKVALPRRRTAPPRRGVHRHRDGERLDHLAAYYLGDPAGFWRICDCNDVIVPEALTDARLIDIPEAER